MSKQSSLIIPSGMVAYNLGKADARREFNEQIAPLRTQEKIAWGFFMRVISLLDGAAAVGRGQVFRQYIAEQSPVFTTAVTNYQDSLIVQRHLHPLNSPGRQTLEDTLSDIEAVAVAYREAIKAIIDRTDAQGKILKNLHAMKDTPASPFWAVFHPDIDRGGRNKDDGIRWLLDQCMPQREQKTWPDLASYWHEELQQRNPTAGTVEFEALLWFTKQRQGQHGRRLRQEASRLGYITNMSTNR